MRRKIIVGIMLTILMLSMLTFALNVQQVEASLGPRDSIFMEGNFMVNSIIRVPADYLTIQEAIDAATPGATISIAVGIYHEPLTINKPLKLIGEKGSRPIFDGGGSGVAITLGPEASGSTVTYIELRNWWVGISLNASNCKIYDIIMYLMVNSAVGCVGAVDNYIYNNTIYDNNIAIGLYYSTRNTIYNSEIFLNSYGVWLQNSQNNSFCYNDFINNTRQVYISTSGYPNLWDIGYPCGGNYWSDYNGTDSYSGPYQNVMGSDGIGDTPYVIDVDNKDNYPLIKPLSPLEPSTRYPWPMFHNNLRHTGYSESPAPTTNQTQWTYTAGDLVHTSPAVADGKVYIGGRLDHKVYCLDASTGTHIWNYTTGDMNSNPTVADGKVYVGSSGPGRVYCLDASTGAHIWNYTTGNYVLSSPAVVDCKVYIGSGDKKVYCLNAFTGAYIWSYTTGDYVDSSPAVADGKVYVGSYDRKVYCLNASTGAYIWSYTTGGIVASSPAVADGKVYVGSEDSKVYCLNASTGAYIWSYTTGDWVCSSPAVADGVVYVGSYDGKVYAFGDVIRVPEDFPTVQEAINNATSGATIIVAPGIYYESVVINKSVTIIGLPGSEPIFDGGGSGIAYIITGTSKVTITGIVITNWDQAIYIEDSNNCKIYYNIMTSNNIAINLTDSAISNTLYGNTISQNEIGINVANSISTTIYHNSFINNTVQIHISMPTGNIWDNGYPSGGNYWSDYTGNDDYSGPDQNKPRSDGIGDSWYEVDTINIDHYPLMKPFGAHDIGITNIILSKTIIGQGFTLNIDLKILNYGKENEALPITVYANTTIIYVQSIVVASRNTTIITFSWNTTGIAKGNYTISVYAAPVPDETDLSDNNPPDGWILITKVGDIGGGIPPQFFKCDGKVDGKDFALFLQCFKGIAQPDAMYLGDLGGGVPPKFFKCDEKVDGKDFSLFLQCFKGLGPDP